MPKKFIPLDNAVGNRLAQARKTAGFTQKQSAQAIGAQSHTPINRWENGIDEPQLGALVTLARLYGVSTDWLLTGQTSSSDLTSPSQTDLDELLEAARHKAADDPDFAGWLAVELKRVLKP